MQAVCGSYSSILSTFANSISTGVERPKIETITFSITVPNVIESFLKNIFHFIDIQIIL